MPETAAHLVDHVFPPLPVRQWVLALSKRLRYVVQRDAALQGTVLRILHCMQGCKMDARCMIYTLGLERRR